MIEFGAHRRVIESMGKHGPEYVVPVASPADVVPDPFLPPVVNSVNTHNLLVDCRRFNGTGGVTYGNPIQLVFPAMFVSIFSWPKSQVRYER